MPCTQSEELSLWLDGELPAERERELSIHLARCAECREAREAFVWMRRGLRAASPPLDPFAQGRAWARIVAGERRALWARRVAVPVPLLGLLLAGVVLFGWLALTAGDGAAPRRAVVVEMASRPAGGYDLARFDRGERAVIYTAPRADVVERAP
jgi:anti-sigma factor RsiW